MNVSILLITTLFAIAAEWLFFSLLRSGLKTGKCSNQAGPIDRAESPVLYWCGNIILMIWVVLIPAFYVILIFFMVTS